MNQLRSLGYRRPRWSLKTNFVAALGILLVVVLIVLLIDEKSIWHRLLIVSGVSAVFSFLFLTFVLYRGVWYDKREKYHFEWYSTDGVWYDLALDPFTFAQGSVGCLAEVSGSLALTVLLALTVGLIFWFGLNLVIDFVAALFLVLFIGFSRSLRLAIAHARSCRGNLKLSVAYSAAYSLLAGVGLYLILVVGRFLPGLLFPR